MSPALAPGQETLCFLLAVNARVPALVPELDLAAQGRARVPRLYDVGGFAYIHWRTRAVSSWVVVCPRNRVWACFLSTKGVHENGKVT